MKNITTLYVDASFSDNRKYSGYGAVLIRNGVKTEFSGEIKGACNSTEAELFGVAEALLFIDSKEEILIYNDNTACVNSINGRKKAPKKSKILNAITIINKFNVKAKWVKGHFNSKENCRADELAKERLFLSEEINFVKNNISIYIATERNDKRVAYSFRVEDNFNTLLFSGHRVIRNSGYGSSIFILSKVIGKPFNVIPDITSIDIFTNEKNILSYLNKLIRMKKRNYVKMNATRLEEGVFNAFNNIKIRIYKTSDDNKLDKLITNAIYALNDK